MSFVEKNLNDRITSLEEALVCPKIADHQNQTDPKRWDYWIAPAYSSPVTGNSYQPSVPAGRDVTLRNQGYHEKARYLPSHMWWWVRDVLRMKNKLAEMPTILRELWMHDAFAYRCPFPAKDDPLSVQWYPDVAAAINERPIKTSLAKFLSKCMPIYSDEYIRDMDAAYRAEQSTELEILTGIDGFRTAYLEGPSSCMSKVWHVRVEEGDFAKETEYFDGNHPVDAYDTPGMGVAVMRDGHGRINARCLVYTNGDDKRMIRVYGDKALERRLTRNGYKYASLAGLKLKAIPLPKYPRTDGEGYMVYAVPYMDGPAGDHSSANAARAVCKLVGEDVLRIISKRQFDRLKPEGYDDYEVTQAASSAGVLTLKEMSPERFMFTCPVTGISINTLESDEDIQTRPVLIGGEVKRILISEATKEIVAQYSKRIVYVEKPKAPKQQVYVQPGADVPTFNDEHYGWTMFDNEGGRLACGYVPWNVQMYPEKAGVWYRSRDFSDEKIVIVNGMAHLAKDMTKVLVKPAEGDDAFGYQEVTTRHVPMLDVMDATKFVRVHSPKRGETLYASTELKIVKTITGRMMVPGWHDVVESVDGKWASERRMASFSFMGETYYMLIEDAKARGLTVDRHRRVTYVPTPDDPFAQKKLEEKAAAIGATFRRGASFTMERFLNRHVLRDRDFSVFHRHINAELFAFRIYERGQVTKPDGTVVVKTPSVSTYVWVERGPANQAALDLFHLQLAIIVARDGYDVNDDGERTDRRVVDAEDVACCRLYLHLHAKIVASYEEFYDNWRKEQLIDGTFEPVTDEDQQWLDATRMGPPTIEQAVLEGAVSVVPPVEGADTTFALAA